MPLLRGSTGLPLPPEFANIDAADAEEDIAAAVAAEIKENGEHNGMQALSCALRLLPLSRCDKCFNSSCIFLRFWEHQHLAIWQCNGATRNSPLVC